MSRRKKLVGLLKRARLRDIAYAKGMRNPSIPHHSPKIWRGIKRQRMHASVDYFSMRDQKSLYDF